MPAKNPLSDGLLRIHKLITRAISVSVVKCDEYIRINYIPGKEEKGFRLYLETLVKVMHAHHLSEDEIVFPYFRGKIEANYSKLKSEHIAMSEMLDDLSRSIDRLNVGDIPSLRGKLDSIQRLWTPHIRTEERSFPPEILDGKMSAVEQDDLVKRVSTHGAKSSGPGYLALPFVIFNLQREDRKEFLKDFPWILKHFIIPVVWRRKWKSMEPFLLN
ncbi:MAG TPA: hemerythrin domain-containing protein [Bacteroidales bacterium]|nr:hemerythrin domain-containing protein [Bacteroidales bacterium]